MKKFLLTAAALCAGVTAYCQVPTGLSVALGANQASLKTDAFDVSAKTGFSAGIGWSFGYHENYNWQMDFMYNNGRFDLGYTDGMATYKDQITRESIDVLLHFNLYVIKPEEDKFYAGVQAGVFGSFAGDWEVKYTDDTGSFSNSYSEIKDANFGISPGLIMGYNNFKLSLKYNLGLNNVLNNLLIDTPDGELYSGPYYDGKIQSLTLTAYYWIF